MFKTTTKGTLPISAIVMMALIALMFSQKSSAVSAPSSQWQSISGANVAKGAKFYDTANRAYFTFNKITNTGATALSGPLRLVVTSSSFPVINASGTDANGKPYFDALAQGATLAAGATGNGIRINFKNTRAAFAYTVEVQQQVETPTDSDGDGIPDATDLCPNDANNACITIRGQVLGNGAALTGAVIKIGDKTAVSDSLGKFTVIGLGQAQIANDNLNDFFPVAVSKANYSSGNAKVVFEVEKNSYKVTVNLQSVSDIIIKTENLSQGVDINKAGVVVGQLTIPDNALPTGVTDITGTVTYLAPSSQDIQSGPALLALPKNADPNATPVPLETYGMMEFDLKDQNGNPVHQLGGDAQVCMKAPAGLVAGNTIPLWYYDVAKGLWKEEGQGTVVSKTINGANTLMICGGVKHFTWWNYDQPINTHACFKFDFRDEITGARLTGNYDWQAEGVTYNGLTPERACNVDSNDPLGVGSSIDSLTVKRSTGGSTEKIRVYTTVNGSQYYLKRDGDGTYSLTQVQADATVFNNPSASASCLTNSNVDQCAFLDYMDANPNGILPLSLRSINNNPPVISEFSVTNRHLLAGESTAVSVTVTDPEDADVSVKWERFCGQNTGRSISPANQGPNASGSIFNANFTDLGTVVSITTCTIRVTATDSDGKSTTDSIQVGINEVFNATLEGTLFGPSGQPMANEIFTFDDIFCTDSNSNSVHTDTNGHYSVRVKGGCNFGRPIVKYQYDNIERTHYEDTRSNIVCRRITASSQICDLNIHLPTVWSPLSGNLYPINGQAITSLKLLSESVRKTNETSSDATTINLAPGAVSYGPIAMPLGYNGASVKSSSNVFYDTRFTIPSTEGKRQDFGDGTAPVTLKYYPFGSSRIVGIDTIIASFRSNSFYSGFSSIIAIRGITDSQAEFTAAAPLGGFFYDANVFNIFSASTKDQPVYVDINSPDRCTVTGVYYDIKGVPIPNASLFGQGRIYTDINGRYTVENVPPGMVKFDPYGTFAPFSLDNCRPVNGATRVVKYDLIDYSK